jgi:amino acid adenylation domain-containing protein
MRSTNTSNSTSVSLADRLEGLSPLKRALVEKRLGRSIPKPANPFSIGKRAEASWAPLALNQDGLLFMEHLDPGTARYNVSDAIRVRGVLNREFVQAALDKIAERHESLRTVFANVDGVWKQIIKPQTGVLLRTFSLDDGSINDKERSAFGLTQQEADVPMDINSGPLFSALLVSLGDEDHIFSIKMHHIISDGWSLGVFWKEFVAIYAALVNETEPSLADLPIQFGDFSLWSREYLAPKIERQVDYWHKQLKGAPALLELPTDRPRPAVQTSSGAQEVVHFSMDLLHKLEAFCKLEGSTLYMTLLTGFKALLARYTGARDLVIGTPIAGRSRTETENLIGYFVNTLVLRSDLSGDPSFREMLARIRTTVLDGFSNQELPFDKIVADLQPERSLSYNPIYQVAFALQESPGSSIVIPGATVEPIKLGLTASKFDLFLSVREAGDGFDVSVEYNTDLFDKETILRLISHYGNLLEAVVADPELALSEIPILSEAERKRLLVEWNDTSIDYPQEPIHHLFEARAAEVPDQTAVLSRDRNLTYAELDHWSNKIGNFLLSAGARPGSRIGICLNRSADMIAVSLGILKCGAAYVPIDPANPVSRLNQVIEDSELSIIFTGSKDKDKFVGSAATIVDIDLERERIESCSSDFISKPHAVDDTAYVMYTSGSTGTPKGAMVPHQAICRLVLNTDYVTLGRNDRIAHLSNVAFDAATFEIWGALLNGASIVIFDQDLVLSPKNFASELKTAGISVMFITTALFNLVAREAPDAFANIETLMVGGEAFDPASALPVLESGPPKRLLNVYGPTESTTFTTWKEISPFTLDGRNVPIGKPIANTKVFILDDAFSPVPVGVTGEIFIGGDGLASGYLKRPELTRERFVDVSGKKVLVAEEDTPAARLYRTGDLAKYLPNGDIEYIGRKDNQVKIRGFRIELGEIEAAINTHPAVFEAVVLAMRDDVDHRMVAFYVPTQGTKVDSNALREYVRDRLPNYMVPGSWLQLSEFPINGNGKIDRKELEKKATHDEHAVGVGPVAPTEELEVKLAWIWQKVLGLKSVGIHENFFDLGGHSLAAVRVFSEIENTLGCRLQLATLFQAPTISELSEVIRAGGWESTWQSLVPIRPNGTKPPFFCVHAVGGNILEYNELVGHLSADQPYYGLQSVGLDGRSSPLTDIRSMAAAYLSEIKSVQPNGPYYLGGRSFGGTVAYEMARQLKSEGEEVALLAIFDSYPKGWQKLYPVEVARSYSRRFLRLRLERHLRVWMRLGTIEKIRYASSKIGYKSKKFKNVLWRIVQKVRPPADTIGSMIRNIEEVNYTALRSYVPDVYEGKVTFFCADEEVCPEENLTGWQRLARGGVDVVNVPGDHQTMIKEPHVGVLAEKLELVLNDCSHAFLGEQK